jgi:hypothetical protein
VTTRWAAASYHAACGPDGGTVPSRCRQCDGTFLDWPDRTNITTLAERLLTIQAEVARLGGAVASDFQCVHTPSAITGWSTG